MHSNSIHHGNRPTHTHTHTPTNTQTGPITIHCSAAQISTQCTVSQSSLHSKTKTNWVNAADVTWHVLLLTKIVSGPYGHVSEVHTAELQSLNHCGKYRFITTGYDDVRHHSAGCSVVMIAVNGLSTMFVIICTDTFISSLCFT